MIAQEMEAWGVYYEVVTSMSVRIRHFLPVNMFLFQLAIHKLAVSVLQSYSYQKLRQDWYSTLLFLKTLKYKMLDSHVRVIRWWSMGMSEEE